MVTGRTLRLVFFGTPAFAVPTLDAMLASRHHVVGVVTQPDRPRGRGQQVRPSPVKARALDAGVPVLQPERMKDAPFLDAYRAWFPDLGVVAAYGKILPESVLAVPPLGLINVHASLLPRHRGAAPIHRAVLAGDAVTGVSIMGVVKALDAGPVYATVARPIGPNDTSVDVEHDLATLGAARLVDVIEMLANGTAAATPQPEAGITYAHRLEKHEGAIDWNWSAAEIHSRVRGLQPWPQAWASWHGTRLILGQTRLPDGPHESDAAPGTVVDITADTIRVTTGGGMLDILTVQLEGRRVMSARDFVAGQRLVRGSRFDPGQPPRSSLA